MHSSSTTSLSERVLGALISMIVCRRRGRTEGASEAGSSSGGSGISFLLAILRFRKEKEGLRG